MIEEQLKAKSPLPKKPLEAVVKEEPEAGYQIVLTFNAKAQFEDISRPEGMDALLLLEHLTFVTNWFAHELVEKGRKA